MIAPVFRACIASMPEPSIGSAGLPGAGAHRGEIDGLTAHHSRWPGRFRDTRDDPQLAPDHGRLIRLRLAGQKGKGLGLQSIAGEDRHSVAGDHVQCRSAAPERVVVHRRQVVVNQRVGVDHLDRARSRQRQRASLGRRPAATNGGRPRRRRASGSDAAVCRPPSGCSAWRRRRQAGSSARQAPSVRAPPRSRLGGPTRTRRRARAQRS